MHSSTHSFKQQTLFSSETQSPKSSLKTMIPFIEKSTGMLIKQDLYFKLFFKVTLVTKNTSF